MTYPETCCVLGCHRSRMTSTDGRAKYTRCREHVGALLSDAFRSHDVQVGGDVPTPAQPVGIASLPVAAGATTAGNRAG